jgi:hypothetical protein
MSKKRQAAIFDRLADEKSRIVTHTRNYSAGHKIPLHFHDRDQLVYASCGVMTVETEEGAWVVPTHRAVWIPEAVPHTISMSGTVAMRTLYLKAGLAKSMPRGMLCSECAAATEPIDIACLHVWGIERQGRRA